MTDPGALAAILGRTHDIALEGEVAAMTGRRVHVIPYGHMATMELDDTRVRLWLTADNRVKSVTLG